MSRMCQKPVVSLFNKQFNDLNKKVISKLVISRPCYVFIHYKMFLFDIVHTFLILFLLKIFQLLQLATTFQFLQTVLLFKKCIIFILINVSPVSDIAVAVKDTIQFVNVSGAVVGNVSEGMSEVRALAYNAELRRMYFSDNEREEGSVFELSVPLGMGTEGQRVSVNPVVSSKLNC